MVARAINSTFPTNGRTTSDVDESGSAPEVMLLDVQLAFLVLAFMMVAIGGVGNAIIIVSGLRLPLTRKKGITTGSRYYIINLALADMGVLTVASVTNLVPMLQPWNLGAFMCKVLLPLRDVLILVSLATITILSLERYWLITRPLLHNPKKRVAKFIILCIWLTSYLVNGVPLLLVTRLHDIGGAKSCGYEWPSDRMKKVHVCFGVAIILVPFVVVTFCYMAIGMTLKEVYKKRQATMLAVTSDETGNKNVVTLILRSKRLVKMLIVVVATFTLCTLPVVLYAIVHIFHEVKPFDHQEVLYTFFKCMMASESAFNPIILLLMASEYRLCINEFATWLKKVGDACSCCCRPFRKKVPDQPYREILQDGNLPSTPV